MRRIFSLMLCVALCFALTLRANAASAQVETLTAQVDVREDGSCEVRINAVVQFLSPQKQFTVPLAKNADDITVSGASYELEEIDGVECIVFARDSAFTGSLSFSCTYTLKNVVTEADNGQTVSIKFPEKGWDFPIKSYGLTVNFPCEISGYPAWYSAYYGVDIENYLDISIGENTLKAKSLERLKDSETVSVKFSFAADTFDLSHLPGQTVSVATILFWLFLLSAVGYRFFRLRTGRMIPIVRQTVVNESTAGEIPCQLLGNPSDLFATLAHWGNLGYLVIRRNANGRILLCKQMEMGSERSAAERKLFYSLFRSGDTIDALEPRVLSVAKTVGIIMQKNWARRMYRKETGSPFLLRTLGLAAGAIASMMMFDLMLPASFFRWILLPLLTALGVVLSFLVQQAFLRFYSRHRVSALIFGICSAAVLLMLSIGAGCFITMLISLALQAFCAVTTVYGGVRQESAAVLVRQLLGLRSFLRTANADALERLSRSDSQYFYRMLPFAEQLGVGSAFARRCGVLQQEACPWLVDAMSRAHTAPEFYATYCQIAATVRRELSISQPAKKSVPSEVSHG